MLALHENIKIELENKTINMKEALYMLFIFSEENFPISATSLNKLVKLGFIKSNKLTKKILDKRDENKTKLKNTVSIKFINEVSKQVPSMICKLLCVTDGDGKVVFTGKGEDIHETSSKYVQNEQILGYYFAIFVFMFPLQSKTNRRWEKHFTGFEYKGARLRYRSKKTGTMFIRMAKNKDMGVFLYATYLYVRSCIRENAVYMTTIKRFLGEYEEWYDEAYEIIKNAKSVDELFKLRTTPGQGLDFVL